MYNFLSFEVFARNTLSVHSDSKISKIARLSNTVFAKTNLKIAFSSLLRTFILNCFLWPPTKVGPIVNPG